MCHVWSHGESQRKWLEAVYQESLLKRHTHTYIVESQTNEREKWSTKNTKSNVHHIIVLPVSNMYEYGAVIDGSIYDLIILFGVLWIKWYLKYA